jgi:hypothetical protein
MAKAFRVRDPAAFDIPEIRVFVERALASNRLIRDVPAALEELKQIADRPELGLFLVGDMGKQDWKGMVFAQSSASAFNPACVIIHFFNDGDADDRGALIRALDSYARETGHDTIVGIDTNDKPRAIGKLFASLGAPKYGGQVFIFDMKESLL